LRCVIQKGNYSDLIGLAEYIARNLQFVDQVAFMGLEFTGFAKSNAEEIWIEPLEYIEQLDKAITILTQAKVHVKIFNHQLCLLPRSLWPYAVRSISDWKNGYLTECDKCIEKSSCGGFFTTSDGKVPSGITAITIT
jgi:hypothetical protein